MTRYHCARSIVEAQPPSYGPHTSVVWTSAMVRSTTRHDFVQLWNRGAHAGNLCLAAGDAAALMAALDLVRLCAACRGTGKEQTFDPNRVDPVVCFECGGVGRDDDT